MEQPRGLERLAELGTGRLEKVAREGAPDWMGLDVLAFVDAFREFAGSEPGDADLRPRLSLEAGGAPS